jgi:putative transposase
VNRTRLNLPRSTYYRTDRHQDSKARAEFRAALEGVCVDWPAYGYRRVTHELRRRGWHVNHKRVSRVMREEALTVRQVMRFLATTDSAHDEPIFPNLARNLRPTGPNQLWVADITYIRLRSEFVFLAVILDAWSRKVVGYAVSKLLDTRLPLAALEAALAARSPTQGLIHHSDRGCQYASRQYRERLAAVSVRGSMSRRANPYDNAQAESFMKTLKHEEVLACNYETMQDVVDRIPRFIEEIYNRRRLYSALGYLPPEEFENTQAACTA